MGRVGLWNAQSGGETVGEVRINARPPAAGEETKWGRLASDGRASVEGRAMSTDERCVLPLCN